MVKRVENRKKGFSEKPPENHTGAGKFNYNYLVFGVICLFVLVFIGIVVASHFHEQNETISKLKTQFTLLETALQNFEDEIIASNKQHRDQIATLNHQSNQSHFNLKSLQEQTATSEQQQDSRIEQLVDKMSQLETTLAGSIAGLASTQNDKLNQLTTQLQTFRDTTTASEQQQNDNMKQIGQQLTQVDTALKGEIAALTSVQNDKLNKLTVQLQTWNDTTTASDKQQNNQIEQFGLQLTQVDTALKTEIATLTSVQNEKLEELTTQLQTFRDTTTASDQQQNDNLKQFGNQLSQVDMALKGEIATLTSVQNDKLQGLTDQLLTWKKETISSVQEQNAQIEQLGNQITQADATLTGELATLKTEQNDKFQGLTEQVQTWKQEMGASDAQQNTQIEQLGTQLTQVDTTLTGLTDNLAALKTEQNDKLQGLTEQVQTWKQEIVASDAQQNTQIEQLGTQLTQVDATLSGNLTDLTGNMAEFAKEQNDKLQGLTDKVQTLSDTTATSEQQQNELIKSLEQRFELIEKDNTTNKPEAEAESEPENSEPETP